MKLCTLPALQVPETEEAWRDIESGFSDKWNLPNCFGALNGNNIEIRAPPNCGNTFYNYKKSNSIILMTLTMTIVLDTLILDVMDLYLIEGFSQRCSLFQRLPNNMLPNGGFIVGDDAFPLKPFLMKPYSGMNLSYEEKIFMENAFGILVSQFRVSERPIACNVDTVDKEVRAACTYIT